MIIEFITVQEAHKLSGVPAITIRKKCKKGLIPGAYQPTPRLWMIPNNETSIKIIKEKILPGRKPQIYFPK